MTNSAPIGSANDRTVHQSNSETSDQKCEFCHELRGGGHSRFQRIYGPGLQDRIVCENRHFVALPTLGQLFPGSLLLMPREHLETIATLPSEAYDAFTALLRSVEPTVARLGLPLLFEHGARCPADGGCGIYHAHVHLVPLPAHVPVSALLGTPRLYDSLDLAYSTLRSVNDYLLVRDTHGQVGAHGDLASSMQEPLPSQFMRRRLAHHFGLSQSWDWRDYRAPESAVLATMKMFGVAG